MPKIDLPMEGKGFRVSPPLSSQISLDENMVQTLALLLGYHQGKRVPLQCSPSGIGYQTGPRLVNVFHWTASAPAETKQGTVIVATEVLCVAHPDNAGRVWVRTKATATVDNAFPLAKGEGIVFTVENLSDLHAMIASTGDKLIVGYSV